jgi:hypothetical protein
MPLAISVDLGWPWWVTTTIAAAVAVAAGVGFFVTRSPLARGVLAVLAVEGVVLAAIAPAVMNDNGGSTSAMHAGAQLTKMEYAHQTDANCAHFGKFAATLGNPKTLPGTAKMLDRLMPAFWNAWLRQGLLQPPPEERSLAGQWMNAMKSYGSSLESVRADASRGDKEGVNAANALANRRAQEAATLSSQLGMNVCFR